MEQLNLKTDYFKIEEILYKGTEIWEGRLKSGSHMRIVIPEPRNHPIWWPAPHSRGSSRSYGNESVPKQSNYNSNI